MKDVSCEKWGCVAGRVVSFDDLDVAEVAVLGSGVSARTLGFLGESEEGNVSNIMTNEMSKGLSNIIYIYHHLFTSLNDN